MEPQTKEEQITSGEIQDFTAPNLLQERDECSNKLYEFNNERDRIKRQELLRNIIGKQGNDVTVLPPFHCDFGKYISIGNGTFINFGCVALDSNYIVIGNEVMLGPNVQLIAATHPTDPVKRQSLVMHGAKIEIKDGAWIGAGSIILPGITIGENSVIGAGSVVTKDIPSGVVACGNPARVIRKVSDHVGWTRDQRDIPVD
ncbi:Maltose/galactoside acetyltransferase domain-containing protein [Entamoeba marina]